MQRITMRVILSAVFGLHEGERYRRLEDLLQRNLALRTGRIGTVMLFLPPLRRDLGTWSPGGRLQHLESATRSLLLQEIADRRHSLEAVDGPTGLRPDAKPASREVAHTDGGEPDKLAGQSVSDLEEFWKFAYPDTFDGDLKPVDALISWDSDARGGMFCDDTTEGLVNAGYCEPDNTIGWDRGVLLPTLRKSYGDMAITMVLAHEYGHALQKQATLNPKGVPSLVAEQQADCFAGVYMRWVAEGKSPRFTLSTGEGLNNLLAAMISFRDPLLENGYYGSDDEHGSAFERISAFQFGFTDGTSACAGITLKEIKERRGDLPVELPANQSGELPVTEASARSLVDALNIIFAPKNPSALTFDA
jgi:predicted metalloprotease